MGELFASGCAVAWAFAVILFRRSGETIPPLALNLFRVGVSAILFLVTLALLRQPLLRPLPVRDYLVLVASGVIAIAISDTLFHMCLNRVGAGVNALIDTMYSPFIALCAFYLLGERLDAWQGGGMVLVISGVIAATRVRPPAGVTRRTLVAGIVLGTGAMATLAFGIVIAKPVLERTDVIWATTIRQMGSLAVLAACATILPGRRRYWAVFRPNSAWRFSVPGTVLGSYFALMMWIAGMKYTAAGTAAILNQTSTLYILVFASLFLKEPFTRRKALAAALAIAGVILVLHPWVARI